MKYRGVLTLIIVALAVWAVLADPAVLSLPPWILLIAVPGIVLIGMTLFAIRSFSHLWVFLCAGLAYFLVAQAIEIADPRWTPPLEPLGQALKLAMIGIAAAILTIYVLFKASAPFAPQRKGIVNVRDGSASAYEPKAAKAYAEQFWQYAVLSAAAYKKDKAEVNEFVRDQELTNWELRYIKPESVGFFRRLWRKKREEQHAVKGLHYHIWFNRQLNAVAVVFRGTRATRISDWIANAHWFIGIRDHYTDIDGFICNQIVERITAIFAANPSRAKTWRGKQPRRLYCCGHSLGGGLARQLAYVFPDGSVDEIAVHAFDSSAVDGRYWLENRNARVFDQENPSVKFNEIFERGEVLGVLRMAAKAFPKTIQTISYYRFNYMKSLRPIKSHNMKDLASALKKIRGEDPVGKLTNKEAQGMQLQLIYDYIKFHIALYLATPPVFMVLAEGLQVKTLLPFKMGMVAMVIIYVLAGMHAGWFMGNHVNRQWADDYLREFQDEAFSPIRRFMHHWMYWAGLLVGAGGLSLAVWMKSLC